jgi:hypothetical protein
MNWLALAALMCFHISARLHKGIFLWGKNIKIIKSAVFTQMKYEKKVNLNFTSWKLFTRVCVCQSLWSTLGDDNQ